MANAKSHSTENSGGRNYSAQHEAQLIADRLLKAANAERQLTSQRNAKAYCNAQEAAVDAQALIDDDELWACYIQNPFWDNIKGAKPSIDDQEDALRYTMRMACGGNSKIASDRKIAVQKLLDSGIEIKDLADELGRCGGFRGVLRGHDDEQDSSPLPPIKPAVPATKRKAEGEGLRSRSVSRVPFNQRSQIAVTVPAEELSAMLTGGEHGFMVFVERSLAEDGHWLFSATYAEGLL